MGPQKHKKLFSQKTWILGFVQTLEAVDLDLADLDVDSLRD